MYKYALLIGGSSPMLYIQWPEKLHSGDEIEVKRSEVKYWKKEEKIINKLFLTKGESEKSKNRDINNYIIKLKVGTESGGRCLENEDATYEGFSAYVV